mmetsp:Transcript_122018/g.352563  ORF Transcript_122018/g.352563 Transcript_122018/m.352563 type:complete len:700 (+) Transcript_122018:84-2183(+)
MRANEYTIMQVVDESELNDDDDDEEVTTEGSVSATLSATVSERPEEELKRLDAELSEIRGDMDSKRRELSKVTRYWANRKQQLTENVEKHRRKVQKLEQEIHLMNHHLTFGRPPPQGPECLQFVDGSRFALAVSAVIFANMVTMSVALMHPHRGQQLLVWEDLFLAFYVVELILRWAYYQGSFLCGQIVFVAWHWLDLVLVLDGLVFVLLPRLGESGTSTRHVRTFQYFRFLRLLRYLRVVRIVRELLRSNLRWVESDEFQSFIMGVIVLNSIVMGLEAEYPMYDFLWTFVEYLFLLVFAFEMVARLAHVGCAHFFFQSHNMFWNILDFLIVVGGLIDQCVMPSVELAENYLGLGPSRSDHRIASVLQLARIARLLRILRLVRLIKHIKPLYTLIVGVVKAMQGMSWVMVLTATVLYIAALLGVKLVGPRGLLTAEHLGGNAFEDQPSEQTASVRILSRLLALADAPLADHGSDQEIHEVTSCFPNMFDAVFNMFKVMQMDFDPMEPLFKWAPVTKYIIMLYVVVMNWAIFSILTAVVSDEMAKVTEKLANDQAAVDKTYKNNKLVAQIFDKLDKNRSGEISQSEFKAFLKSQEEVQELCDAAGLELADLQEFFDIWSHSKEDGEELHLTRHCFVTGLQKEQDAVSQRAMLKMEKRLDDVGEHVACAMQKVDELIQRSCGPSMDNSSNAWSGSPHSTWT